MKYLYLILAVVIIMAVGCTDRKGAPTNATIDIVPGDQIPPPDQFVPVEQLPVRTYEEIPKYPIRAYERGIEGIVLMQAFIDSEGAVRKALAARCNQPGWGFEKAAIKAAYMCRYEAAIQNGQPIGIWIAYKVDFVID